MNRKRIQFLVSLLVTALFLWLAFRPVNLPDLWRAMGQVNYLWAIPFMAVTILSMYFRTLRWKYLLEPVVKVPAPRLFSPIMICFALNSILPARAGEFARAYLVSRDHKARFGSTFATVIVERIADGLGLLAFFVVILAVVQLDEEFKMPWGGYVIDSAMLQQLSRKLLVICVVMLAGSLLMLWTPFRRLVQRLVGAVPVVPHGLKEGVNHFIESFVQGFHSLRSLRIVFWITVHTALVWLLVGWSLQIMSFGFPETESFRHMTFLEGMATSIIICIAILIPAAPGYWGLYEVGAILALLMLGVAKNQTLAMSYALVAHFLQMAPILVLGFYFMWRRHMGLAEITASSEAESPGENALPPVVTTPDAQP